MSKYDKFNFKTRINLKVQESHLTLNLIFILARLHKGKWILKQLKIKYKNAIIRTGSTSDTSCSKRIQIYHNNGDNNNNLVIIN